MNGSSSLWWNPPTGKPISEIWYNGKVNVLIDHRKGVWAMRWFRDTEHTDLFPVGPSNPHHDDNHRYE